MVSEREAGSRESPEPVLIAEPASDTSSLFVLDPDGHGPFRDMCLAYGDFYRPIFLETIRDWFIRNANKTELAELRKAISARSANLGKGGKRGRPRAKDDHNWLMGAKTAAWRRLIDRWTWRRIAESEGTKLNPRNIRVVERTLSRRQDQYAAIIWNACSQTGTWRSGVGIDANLKRLRDALETARFRQWLWTKAGLFGPSSNAEWTDGCKKIVLGLVGRGEKAAGRNLPAI